MGHQRLVHIVNFESARKLTQVPSGHPCGQLYGLAFQLEIHVDGELNPDTFCQRLSKLLQPLENGCPVVLDYRNEVASCDIRLDDRWRINPTDEQLQELKFEFGEASVELVFG